MTKRKFAQWMDHDNCKLEESNLSQFCNILCLYKRQIICYLCVTSSKTLILWLVQPKSHVINSLCPVTTCCGWAILFINSQALLNLCKLYLFFFFKSRTCDIKQQTENKLKSSILASAISGVMLGVWKMHSKAILFYFWWLLSHMCVNVFLPSFCSAKASK